MNKRNLTQEKVLSRSEKCDSTALFFFLIYFFTIVVVFFLFSSQATENTRTIRTYPCPGAVAVSVWSSLFLDTRLVKWRIGPWWLGTEQQHFNVRIHPLGTREQTEAAHKWTHHSYYFCVWRPQVTPNSLSWDCHPAKATSSFLNHWLSTSTTIWKLFRSVIRTLLHSLMWHLVNAARSLFSCHEPLQDFVNILS